MEVQGERDLDFMERMCSVPESKYLRTESDYQVETNIFHVFSWEK